MDEPKFSVWLGNTEEGTEGGEIMFGGVDPDHYKGTISESISFIRLRHKLK